MAETEAPLWIPSKERITASNLTRFTAFWGKLDVSYKALHKASITDRPGFWSAIWEFCGVIGEKGERVLTTDTMPGAQFFPDAKLNFAENLLRRNDATPAIIFRGEDQTKLCYSWADLTALVSRLQQAMAAQGIQAGDRVAALMPNRPETIAIMLAAVSLGAVFSSCSPDFGPKGILDRFGQIKPRLVFAGDGYWYGGKAYELGEKLAEIVPGLTDTTAFIIVPCLGVAEKVAAQIGPKAKLWEDFFAPFQPQPLKFQRFAFNHPLFILFSSGTTGAPKCIVHGAGGTLLQLMKEHQLHCDIHPGDKVFYFTTCGWMMWNWLATALASEAILMLFDGSSFYPRPDILFDYAAQEGVTLFGASAKYIDACSKAGLKPGAAYDLSALRTLASTGSPLSPDSFRYVYNEIKPDLHLISMSGGTDIVSSFVTGNPVAPVYAGEIQVPGLGTAIEIWDEDGQPLAKGKGELVCTQAFPSMPVQFWNDPNGQTYQAAYFERFPGIWCHGDFAAWGAQGGLIIYGRSDATLNPGGVRIGTAEIYAEVEAIPEVLEALAIGQDFKNDVRVILFLRLKDGIVLDAVLEHKIKTRIRAGASPRHVPAKIIAVADIPRTKSGKISELAVRDIVHGRAVKNSEALANPEALELFRDLPELKF